MRAFGSAPPRYEEAAKAAAAAALAIDVGSGKKITDVLNALADALPSMGAEQHRAFGTFGLTPQHCRGLASGLTKIAATGEFSVDEKAALEKSEAICAAAANYAIGTQMSTDVTPFEEIAARCENVGKALGIVATGWNLRAGG